MQPLPAGEPTDIGGYRVLGVLERYGLLREYLVQQGKGAPLCLRTILFLDSADEQTRERYRREVAAWTGLHHPNLRQVVDWGVWQNGSVYVVTAPLAGRRLDQVLAEEAPMAWPQARRLLEQLLQALEVLHGAGMVHRNLTPAGLNLDPQGVLQIVNYAMVSQGAPGAFTPTGVSMGDCHYIAPEQLFDAKRVDARSDLYSVGALAYQMVSGRPPHGEGKPAEILSRVASGDVVPLENLDPAVSGWVASLMTRDRQARLQTAREALRQLPGP
jgi:serine/threonine protein kinase